MSLEIIFCFVFILVAAVQLYYHWAYFCLLPNCVISDKKNTTPSPVSIVVAARNEAKLLPTLIIKLLDQDHPNFELIIVNDRSEDESASILNELEAKHKKLKVIHVSELPQGWNGKKHALQLGIEAAQHEIILLTDADCLPNSNQWISKMAGSFKENTDFVLGFSPYENKEGFLNQIIQFETLLTAIQYLSFAIKRQPYMGVGRNLAYRKSVFLKHSFQGYESKTGGDDDLFVNAHATAANTEICIHPDAHVTSIPKSTWRDYFRQKVRHLSVGKNYRKKDQTRLGLFALSSLTGWIMLFWAILASFNIVLILMIFGIKSLSFYVIFTRSGRKLKMNMAYWALPFLDLCLNLYYPMVGLVALIAKKVKWS
ncbi:glycosyltransferase [Roseivirga seohaensis]|uniref:glycosyltransferase n=1 Tax=Roseivirga seohaensis TaxID=1914963 RepID=UPI000A92382E|nr:glycosyltransferase [Roseivirga seohaensis]